MKKFDFLENNQQPKLLKYAQSEHILEIKV